MTYSDELYQGVVDEGSLRQEEAASWTQVMKEKQFLLLEKKEKGFVSVTYNYKGPSGQTGFSLK